MQRLGKMEIPVVQKRRGPPLKSLPPTARDRYAVLRAKYPAMTKADAMELAGYCRKSKPPSIDAQLAMTIERQREHAIRTTGYTIAHALQTLTAITRDDDANPGDKIRAVHEANTMLPGYHAPEQVQIKQLGIFAELTDLTTTELSQIINHLAEEDHITTINSNEL